MSKISKADLRNWALAQPHDTATVVYANWCPHCRSMVRHLMYNVPPEQEETQELVEELHPEELDQWNAMRDALHQNGYAWFVEEGEGRKGLADAFPTVHLWRNGQRSKSNAEGLQRFLQMQ